ncbi:MAG: hypothetical protein Q9168_005677 [Polycauliona sp. 1 TL-2023]
MPMAQPSPADVTLQALFKNCFLSRISYPEFNERFAQFEVTTPKPALAPVALARALLDAGTNGHKIDPRLPLYLEALLDTEKINVVDLLVATTESHGSSDGVPASLNNTNDTLQSKIFQLLTKRLANETIDNDAVTLAFLHALLPWMSTHPASASLGLLVSTTLNSPSTQHAMTVVATKRFKTIFAKRLIHFINSLSSTNIQLASALSFYQKQYDLQDGVVADDSLNVLHGVDMGALSFQDSVMDNEPTITRAGLYVYLNALVCLRCLTLPLLSIEVFETKANTIPTDHLILNSSKTTDFKVSRVSQRYPFSFTRRPENTVILYILKLCMFNVVWVFENDLPILSQIALPWI